MKNFAALLQKTGLRTLLATLSICFLVLHLIVGQVVLASNPCNLQDIINHTEYYKSCPDDPTPCGGSSTPAACSCSTLNGADNAAKIWNFLISKGLSPPQAAGIMGNLQAESSFNPAAAQTPNAWDDLSDASHEGVGIAQWDLGRRAALINAARAQGKDPKDLDFQLNYLFQEATSRGDWAAIQQTNDPASATLVWHQRFERSSDGPSKIQGRINNAIDILTRFGSTSPSNTTSNGGGCSQSSSKIVQTALSFSWPDRDPQSSQLIPKPEYAAALKQFNPNAPYNGADCGAFVATVMHASGADPNYPLSGTSNQEAYVRAHPELYDVVNSVASKNDLQLGDILIVNQGDGQGANGHTYIFVGSQPPKGYDEASASGGDRMANLGNAVLHDNRGNYIRARLKQ